MDYTTLQRVKSELHSQATHVVDDSLFNILITAASRAIDRKVTGTTAIDSNDYFALADVAAELTRGQISNDQILILYPRKPQINSVTSVEYRVAPQDLWKAVDSAAVQADGPRVEAWLSGGIQVSTRSSFSVPGKVLSRISYNGGYAATVNALPEDIQEVATMLAIRYYREAEGGLQDSIGVAELAQMIYTKAWPVRALAMLNPFMRRQPWRGFA